MRERIAKRWELLVVGLVRALLPAGRRHRVVPAGRPVAVAVGAGPVERPAAHRGPVARADASAAGERLLRQLQLERRRVLWRAAYEQVLAGGGEHRTEGHA